METDYARLSNMAINILYRSSKALVMDDQDYIDCHMCISHDGKLILSCSKEQPAYGVLIVLKGDIYDLQIIGNSKPVDFNSAYKHRFEKYYPHKTDIKGLVEITPLKYLLRDKNDNETNLDLKIANPFSGETEDRMIAHMNEDHVDAMKEYCRDASIELNSHEPLMLGIDPYGFDLLVNNQTLRFQFNNKCETARQVRQALVELAKKARA